MNNVESYTPPAAVEAPPGERRNWCYWQNGKDLVRVIRGWPEFRRIPHPGPVTAELVEQLNTEIGVTPNVAFEIVGSSMRAGRVLRRPKHSL